MIGPALRTQLAAELDGPAADVLALSSAQGARVTAGGRARLNFSSDLEDLETQLSAARSDRRQPVRPRPGRHRRGRPPSPGRQHPLFRELMSDFAVLPGEHPIVAVLTGDAVALAHRMRSIGVHVVPISFPVVPRGTDRIRVQLSAAHREPDVRAAVDALQQATSPDSRQGR